MIEELNPEDTVAFYQAFARVLFTKPSPQRKQVQSHAMNSSTPHVFNTPAILSTRHRPNLIENDAARDDPLKMSAAKDRKKRG